MNARQKPTDPGHRTDPSVGGEAPRISWLARTVVAAALLAAPMAASAQMAPPSAAPDSGARWITMPLASADRGRRLFVTKGCVVCHAVHGVGGRAAPALDATSASPTVDVLGFVSRLMRGAPAMFMLQEAELGYRIELGPVEIADLAAFATDPAVQAKLSQRDIPEPMRDWFIDQPYWLEKNQDWRQDLPERFPDVERLPGFDKGAETQ